MEDKTCYLLNRVERLFGLNAIFRCTLPIKLSSPVSKYWAEDGQAGHQDACESFRGLHPTWMDSTYLAYLENYLENPWEVWGESTSKQFHLVRHPRTDAIRVTMVVCPQRLRLGANRGTMAKKRYLPQMLDRFCVPVFRRPTYEFRIISGQVTRPWLSFTPLPWIWERELVHERHHGKLKTSEEIKLIRRSIQTGTRRSGWQSTPCGVPPRKAFICILMLTLRCFHFVLDNLAVVFGMRERERERDREFPKTQQQSSPFVPPPFPRLIWDIHELCVFMLWNERPQRCSQPTLTTIAAMQLGKCKTWAIAKLPKRAISQFQPYILIYVYDPVLPRFATFIRVDTVAPDRKQAARGDNSCQCSRTQRTLLDDLAGINHVTTPHNFSHN